MLLGFELFLNCDINIPAWVLTNWVDYMDPNAMTTLLGDAIFNIEEEEYWEACQHTLKDPYEARMDDEDDEVGKAPSDDDEGSGSEDSNSDGSKDNDSDNSEYNDGGNDDSEGSDSADYGS